MNPAAGFPSEGMELTHILVVSDLVRSRTFYSDVLGAEVYREYGGTSCVLRFMGAWLLLASPESSRTYSTSWLASLLAKRRSESPTNCGQRKQ